MSYRKINVDNKEYEYTVGKTFTKIKGLGLYKNSDIGDCVKTDLKYMPVKYIVAPYNVANAIKGVYKPRKIEKCSHGTETHETTFSPYALEVNNELVEMINCKKCINNSHMDI